MIVILGAGGQVGQALNQLLAQRQMPVRALMKPDCDIADAASVERAIQGASMVVNCAAYTAVDRAEAEAELAHDVNARGAANVAAACERLGITMIHLSTDYIFDGNATRPWREDDVPNPINVYGHSKLAGEIAVRERAERHIIVRTSWVFSAWGNNFVKTILRLAQTRPKLQVVHDQIGCPTAAGDIAVALAAILAFCRRSDFADWGTYHFCGAPPVSWYEFAGEILQQGEAVLAPLSKQPVLSPITTEEYPTPARRPPFSVLDCTKILTRFGIAPPDWRIALADVLRRLAAA